ncbi:Trichodiene synthase [Fusarium equiseti]|uniref:Trichodiene synthase n=1 Tax=Fusarium equiseti TaxID=61235 RepID=A0ABQ8R7Y5_FUSEQ|nr:Trichodiene synthase [Fusarium equiseti]
MENFPTDYFLNTTVRLLEYIKYRDSNYTREERIENLHYAYTKAAHHFAQPRQQQLLKVDPKRLQASLQTIVGMVVYSWAKVSKELTADLSIHYTYTLVLDDSKDDPHPTMENYFDDLQAGREQAHPCTLDFFEGCWIEQYNFGGYPGSRDYPGFLRRMNGLGHCVGASLWPKAQFDEHKQFLEITSSIAQMENWMVWVNDLMSFYKESDGERDQISLVTNYVTSYEISLNEALEKLTQDTLHSSKQMVAVFSDKDPQVMETIERFMHGYAATVGAVSASEWAYPSVAHLAILQSKDIKPAHEPIVTSLELVE